MSSEPVGSLAEEAARLIAALQGWAQDQRPRDADHDAGDGQAGEDSSDGAFGGGHHDPLSPECRYCPLCALARVAKATTPEVRDHLSSAALSLALAVKGFLDSNGSASGEGTPVEKIDLAED
jgi:hypothetical protein